MPQRSAGILLYRFRDQGAEVLLVHPGGPFWAKRDAGVWSIPKGLIEENEDALAAAKREFEEELGIPLKAKAFTALNPVRQKSGKTVIAWAAQGDADTVTIRSNMVSVEFPYKSGRIIQVPEVDRAEWFDLKTAAVKILPAQQPLLDELAGLISL